VNQRLLSKIWLIRNRQHKPRINLTSPREQAKALNQQLQKNLSRAFSAGHSWRLSTCTCPCSSSL